MNFKGDSYIAEDRKRLGPAAQKVREFMEGRGWMDLDEVGRAIGVRSGTVASRLREMTDRDHLYLGLAYERRRKGNGLHEYRLVVREPGQIPLFDEVLA